MATLLWLVAPQWATASARSIPAALRHQAATNSHAVIAGGLVFVSGQLPITAAGERLNNASFEEQARQSLANVQAALESVGSSVARLVQVRVYVTSIGNWPAFNQLYKVWAGQSMPARAVVPVPELHYGFAIEVKAVGVAGAAGDIQTALSPQRQNSSLSGGQNMGG